MTPEIQSFLTEWEREFATTARLIGAIPPASLGYRPHPKSKTAAELAWHLVTLERWAAEGYLAGQMPLTAPAEMPGTLEQILRAFSLQHQSLASKVRQAPEGAWTRKVPLFGQEAPGSVILRGPLLNHMIHHRGQLSVYLRLMGSKVPAVYGPSADDKG